MNTRRLVLLFLLLAVSTTAVRADHPNVARGFDIGRPYQMNGIDNINLFNGNLTVTIPIGQRYHVNGNLGYGLTLVYSGNVWDSLQSVPCPSGNGSGTQTVPNQRSNAGLGWVLSMGRLFAGNHFPVQAMPGGWYYESPDGALHDFSDSLHGTASGDSSLRYTRDGSYIRMKINASDRTVELPDGTQQIFEDLQTVPNGTWSAATTPQWNWRLTSIKDRFGNSVAISYSSALATGNDPQYPEIWTISDGPRTQKVYFIAAAAPYSVKLDHVTLSTFSGTADWKFGYSQRSLTAYQGKTCVLSQTWSVPLLTSVTLPPGANGVSQVYSMLTPGTNPTPYYILDANNYPAATGRGTGHLLGMQLPTGGWLEWDYKLYSFYDTDEGWQRSIAVLKRRMMDASHALVGEWTYRRVNSTARTCTDPNNPGNGYTARSEQLVVAITSPENNTSVHYFSIEDHEYDPELCNASTLNFQDGDYALPFSRATSQSFDGATVYLSSETFAGSLPDSALVTGPPTSYRVSGTNRVRSEWVAYETEDKPIDGAAYNARETAHATYFDDDTGCAGSSICYAGIRRFGFDGAGHFRQSSTSGNFPAAGNLAGNFKTTFTNFPNFDSSGTWLLNRYTEQCAVDESAARTEEVHSCDALAAGSHVVSGPYISKTCFDATTGFLNRARTLSGAELGNNDVIVAFTPDHGNVGKEEYYGGDVSSVSPTDDVCTGTLSPTYTPTYTINHTYSYGSLATTQYAGFTFKSVDNVINANTGLVSASRDTAQRETDFNYDSMGRVLRVSRAGEADINYSYTEATGTSPAQVTANQVSASSSNGGTQAERTIQNASIFDGFGRVIEEQRLMPSGTARRKTEYNASGWTTKIYEWEATPTYFTLFSDFDAFGRAHTITAPDSSVSTVDYSGARTVKRTVSVHTSSTAASNVKTTQKYDRLGRLIEVVEPDPTPISDTKYEYDAADRLRTVTMTDSTTSTSQTPRTFTYDGRGFLTSEVHPENGTTTYGRYDARGHVGEKSAGPTGSPDSAFDLRYKYDGAERLTAVTHPPTRGADDSVAATVKSFAFADANDGTNYKMGKLETATRKNYLPAGAPDSVVTVSETYKYQDDAGRLTSKVTTVTGNSVPSQTYTQSYTYNDLGLLASTTYPSCPQCGGSSFTVTPAFKNGLLKSIDNFTTNVTYDPNGLVTEIDHPGGIADVIDVDSHHMPRPSRIQFKNGGYDPCTPPSIVSQPQTQQISAGSAPSLSVGVASGASTPLTYQWFKNDSSDPLPGETGATCCSGAISASSRYRVAIVNSCGRADSNTAYVQICGSPFIFAQPQNQQIQSGTSTSFLVSANGCSLSYQWYQGNQGDTSTPVQGGTGSSFNTGPLTSTTAYWVRVTDNHNTSVNSATAYATVCGAPTITQQPSSNTYTGAPITLSVDASGGSCTLSYQWYQGTASNTSNPVGTGATYVVQGLTATTSYWVRVSSAGGSVDSVTATITFSACNPAVAIAQQPAASTTYSGSPIILSVQARDGCPPYHYHWYKNPPSLEQVGGDSPSFAVPTPTSTQSYWVIANDSTWPGGTSTIGQAYSGEAVVHCAPPAINLQPTNTTYTGPVTLTVTASGCGPFQGQWYRGFKGDTSSPQGYASNFTASLSFTTPALTATTRYWVRIRYDNAYQFTIDSDTAVVTVPLPAPGQLTATWSPTQAQPNRITVNWGASSGQDHYELQRLSGGSWATILQQNTQSYTDNSCPANTTCVYRVRAVDQDGGSGSPFTSDLATTMSFAAIQANVTTIAFSHFDQVRTAINSIREAQGGGDLSWRQMLDQAGFTTAVEPAQGGVIYAAHLLALRDAMNKIRAAVGVSQPPYGESVSTGTPIRAVHLIELQQRAQ